MGLFSFFKKNSEASDKATIKSRIPSMEEQRASADSFVNGFLSSLYDNYDKTADGEFASCFLRIAGITNYCSRKDCGLISGLTFIHSGNQYDKTAIALGRVENGRVGSIFGYVPKDDKNSFNEMVGNEKQRPFIGFIKPFMTEDGRESLGGVVKVYIGYGAKAYEAMVNDTLILQGLFNGYYMDKTIEEQGETLDDLLYKLF